MKPDLRFSSVPPSFWAYVRTISEWVGYTYRKTKKTKRSTVKVPSAAEIAECLQALDLATEPIFAEEGQFTEFGRKLHDFFKLRAEVLNTQVEPALLTAKEAEQLYNKVRRELKSKLVVTMNKQKGKKRKPAYLTGLVNMLVAAGCGSHPCDFDPRALTTFTKERVPVRTFSRRVDGAFPATKNPVAIWEIKEYYHTTTFGSRVADGVYETQLDGMELKELGATGANAPKHYLFLDAHYTWWECGKSYLCRIFDMVNMGLVDEVIVGRNVVTRVPDLVKQWIDLLERA